MIAAVTGDVKSSGLTVALNHYQVSLVPTFSTPPIQHVMDLLTVYYVIYPVLLLIYI